MNRRAPSYLVVFLVSLGFVSSAFADTLNYGDFTGSNVEFIDVTEISNDPLPLFGVPKVIGDSLDFPTPGFISESTAGDIDFLDGRLRFDIVAAPGLLIDSISLSEFGAYFNFGDDSISIASAIAFVQVGTQLFDASFVFEETGTGSGPWMEDLVIDIPNSRQVTFVMDNQLFTRADDAGVAFIDKKGLRITVQTIPEPATGLIGLGLLSGLVIGRRRRV